MRRLFLVGLITVAIGVPDPAAASWTVTGAMKTPRYDHTATLLRDGRVLVVGGAGPTNCDGPFTTSSELFDPITGTWSETGNLNKPRSNHSATLLQNGEVLVASGVADTSAELYDPATGTWRRTGSLNTIAKSVSATLLYNGKVLAVGLSSEGIIGAELYDPASATWSRTAAPSFIPTAANIVPVGDKVLAVAQGSPWDYDDLVTELYDPFTEQWSPAGRIKLFWAPAVTLLRDGRVLVTGLYGANYTTQAELYNPYSKTWSVTGSLSTFRHYGGFTSTLLGNGQVLVAGGVDYSSQQPVTSEELFDPISGKWSFAGRLLKSRNSHTATLLGTGEILIAGGTDGILCGASTLAGAELYDPRITSTDPIDHAGSWILRNSGLQVNGVTEVALDPANPELMYAAAQGGIFKTNDGGTAWARSGNLARPWAVAIDPHNPSTVFASSNDGAEKTTDGGANWTTIHPNPTRLSGARAIAIDPINPSTVYAVLITNGTRDDRSDGLSKSVDGGATFSYINSGLPFTYFYYGFESTALAIDPSAPSTLYEFSSALAKSTNSGASWSPLDVGFPIYVSALAVDPSQSSFVYAATQQGLLRSSNRGFTWQQFLNGLPTTNLTDVIVDPAKTTTVYVSTSDSGVFKSIDRGEHFTTFSEGLAGIPISSLAIDATGTFLAAATERGVFTYSFAEAITLPPALHASRLGSDPARLARLVEQSRALNANVGLLFSSAGNAAGAMGTVFRSDVTLMNGNATAQDIVAVWLAAGSDGTDAPSLRLTLPPSATTITDFVGKIGFSGVGSLLFIGVDSNMNPDASSNLTGFSRIWTASPTGQGSVSQSLPASRVGALGGNSAATAIGLRMDSSFRTNVGIVNLDSMSHTFQLTLTGERTSGTLSVAVPPFSMRQVPVPDGDYGALTALFQVVSGQFPWAAYGSSVDNLSGDGWASQAAPMPK